MDSKPSHMAARNSHSVIIRIPFAFKFSVKYALEKEARPTNIWAIVVTAKKLLYVCEEVFKN